MSENSLSESPELKWFAMRDVKRPNDPDRAYKVLAKKGFEVFTPIESRMTKRLGRYIPVEKALFPDLLFVHTTREFLDPQVASLSTLRYRLRAGFRMSQADSVIIVDDTSMNNFRLACNSSLKREFLTPSEIDSSLIGRRVKVFCNAIPGKFVGNLLRIKGRGLKVLVELNGLLRMKLHLSGNDVVQFIDDKAEEDDSQE